jgi:hypothetical protein
MGAFLISDHAVVRFVERHEEAGELDDTQLGPVLLAELERSTAYGGQIGGDQLRLLPCGLVAVVGPDGFVKTVLTRQLAIANMEAYGLRLSSYRVSVSAPLRRLSAIPWPLRRLAEYHLRLGIGKKARNQALRDHGYDPAGEDGDQYRTIFRELRKAQGANGRPTRESTGG